jgi:hypothetical protein
VNQWSRGEHNIRDFWTCLKGCYNHASQNGAEQEAVAHTMGTGHTTAYWHQSVQYYHPAGGFDDPPATPAARVAVRPPQSLEERWLYGSASA